ncbi:MAG: DNA polymerase I [Deltaproteobacteria bacterium]|nr:DNA polymerase I [Deltaproteobacteria bacterium]
MGKETGLDNEKLVLVDATHTIYRTYHAIRGLRSSSGAPTNAIFGFTRILIKLIKEHAPCHIGLVFDAKGPTFRHKEYADYKAQRKPPDTEMVEQIEPIKDMVRAFGLPVLERSGFEADDIIGTLAEIGRKRGMEVLIVGSDKDLMQLVGDRVKQFDPVEEKLYGPKEVEEKWGVPPGRISDLLGLAGDSSDNIPGVPGIGPKTAADLIKRLGTIEDVIVGAGSIKPHKKVYDKIKQNSEKARLSKRLAVIRRDVPMEGFGLDDLFYKEFDPRQVRAELEKWDLKTLATELAPRTGLNRAGYRLAGRLEDVKEFLEKCAGAGLVSFDFETTSKTPTKAEVVGIALARWLGKEHEPDSLVEALYVPVGHRSLGATNLDTAQVFEILKPVIESPEIVKIGQNLKYEEVILLGGIPADKTRAGKRLEIDLCDPIEDTMLMSYLLNPGKPRHSLDAIARDRLSHDTIKYSDVAGKGTKQISFAEVDLGKAVEYACEDAHVALAAREELAPLLKESGLFDLYKNLEIPLVHVLASMERTGVLVDRNVLDSLSKELAQKARILLETCRQAAGDPGFNPNSPKQLGHILFDKLKFPVIKRTKTGPSTAQPVLEELAGKIGDHPLLSGVLGYRQITKLKNTYVDALVGLMDENGRIHTSYNQHVTSTGRLSSSDPNLQNIPVRGEEGKKIRAAFVAPKGKVLLSADYSQVELRILAHLSEDPTLRQAFENGEDIHSRTAAEVFGVKQEEITPEQRRQAKTVNFGVVYGQSAFGLAKELGISREQAKHFIDTYFARYPGVRNFWEKTLAKAGKEGFVTTIMGRKRYLPELKSKNGAERSAAERAAINTPIQGSAADLIKAGMINLWQRQKEGDLQGISMILQVHDELVFEVPENLLEHASSVIKSEMENVLDLLVPLVVDIGYGRNWAEAH